MIFERFVSRARKYGVRRILTDSDLLLSLVLWFSIFGYETLSCGPLDNAGCTRFQSQQFVVTTTQFAISLTALILTGLSVLIALSDDNFLADLRELGIYVNILFVFEYTLYLAATTSIIGAVVLAYETGTTGFYGYLFFLLYMVLSLVSLIEMVVTFGTKKAEFEYNDKSQ